MVPKMMFLTKGVGVDKNRLSSFELALRNAGIERFNLVHVSSILPPLCKIVPQSEGLRHLEAGETFFVEVRATIYSKPETCQQALERVSARSPK